jgi:hypothetical protein
MGFRATAKADEGRAARRLNPYSRAAQLREHQRQRVYAPVLGVAAVLYSHNVDDFDGDLPAVGAMPRSSPLWVPRSVFRVVTLSPSAI